MGEAACSTAGGWCCWPDWCLVVVSAPFFGGMSIWALALDRHFMWSRAHLAAPLFISGAFTLLVPVVGYLTDRFGPRRLVLTGLCILAAGFVFFGLIQSVATYYASFIIIVIGAQLCGSILLVVMLSHWFAKSQGCCDSHLPGCSGRPDGGPGSSHCLERRPGIGRTRTAPHRLHRCRNCRIGSGDSLLQDARQAWRNGTAPRRALEADTQGERNCLLSGARPSFSSLLVNRAWPCPGISWPRGWPSCREPEGLGNGGFQFPPACNSHSHARINRLLPGWEGWQEIAFPSTG